MRMLWFTRRNGALSKRLAMVSQQRDRLNSSLISWTVRNYLSTIFVEIPIERQRFGQSEWGPWRDFSKGNTEWNWKQLCLDLSPLISLSVFSYCGNKNRLFSHAGSLGCRPVNAPCIDLAHLVKNPILMSVEENGIPQSEVQPARWKKLYQERLRCVYGFWKICPYWRHVAF